MIFVLEGRCQCGGYGLGNDNLREIEVVVCSPVEGDVEENEQVLADAKKAVDVWVTVGIVPPVEEAHQATRNHRAL